jgi:hypothetical protein
LITGAFEFATHPEKSFSAVCDFGRICHFFDFHFAPTKTLILRSIRLKFGAKPIVLSGSLEWHFALEIIHEFSNLPLPAAEFATPVSFLRLQRALLQQPAQFKSGIVTCIIEGSRELARSRLFGATTGENNAPD